MSAAETAVMEASPDTQSEHDWFSVGSEGSESEDELLLEFGDARNSDENDSKDSSPNFAIRTAKVEHPLITFGDLLFQCTLCLEDDVS